MGPRSRFASRGSGLGAKTFLAPFPAGTLYLWIFWPSFASATTAQDGAEPWAVLNIYFSMAASTLAAFVLSPILYEEGTLQAVGPVPSHGAHKGARGCFWLPRLR